MEGVGLRACPALNKNYETDTRLGDSKLFDWRNMGRYPCAVVCSCADCYDSFIVNVNFVP
jgi:hypothetical protein